MAEKLLKARPGTLRSGKAARQIKQAPRERPLGVKTGAVGSRKQPPISSQKPGADAN